MRILRLSKLNDHFTRYDLSIEGIHNFVAEGVVVHNTSAHLAWSDGQNLNLFSGGESPVKFAGLFDTEALKAQLKALFGNDTVTIYGEAYGGAQQGMSKTYGPQLKFIVFDVEVNGKFVDVPTAHQYATSLGLEFVDYALVEATVENLDRERDKPSTQAQRNGCGDNTDKYGQCPPIREGVVIRPVQEFVNKWGDRVICKHKRAEFQERVNQPKPQEVDPNKQKVLEDAEAVANEWVVAVRLEHVLDKLGNPRDLGMTGKVIQAMVEDVMREASGEIADTKEVRKAIGVKAAKMFKALCQAIV